jgi:GNAT superfamily N-acetyltransferase
MNRPDRTTADLVRIRGYRPWDRAAVLRLNREGVLAGGGAVDCSTDDFDAMETTYFRQPQDHFWVAQINDQLVGMIGLTQQRPNIAVIRRLRVAPDWQGTDLCPRLVKTALWHSWVHGAVKVVIEGPCSSGRAIEFLGAIGFQCSRSRSGQGCDLVELYPTLYGRPPYEAAPACERGTP